MIGIISDTHDNIDNVKKAVDLFKSRNVEFVLHCGDVVAPATILYFKGLKTKWIFGNCDGDRELMVQRVKEIGGEHYGPMLDITISGKRIVALHGDHPEITKKVISTKPDYLIHGHTHTPEDKRQGKTRVLCPGGHYLGDEKVKNKIIILDLSQGTAEFVQVQ